MGNLDPMSALPRSQRRRVIADEKRRRKSGAWGEWETLTFPPRSVFPTGWAACFTTAHKNKVFSVLDRMDASGARHLAVASLSGERPTWHEMQRIKDDLAGPEATAVEVYPPKREIVDDADMYHIWVLPGDLNFSIYAAEPDQ